MTCAADLDIQDVCGNKSKKRLCGHLHMCGEGRREMADPGVTSEASYLCYQRKRLELGRGHGMCLLDTMTQMREQLTWEERVAH